MAHVQNHRFPHAVRVLRLNPPRIDSEVAQWLYPAMRCTSASRWRLSTSSVPTSAISEEAAFQEDLNADSLDLVELIMELEDQFGLKIPDEDAQKLTTVGRAVDYVVEHQ